MAASTQTIELEAPGVVRVDQPAAPLRQFLRSAVTRLKHGLMRGHLRSAVRSINAEGAPALARVMETARRLHHKHDRPPERVFASAMAGLETEDFVVQDRRAGVTFQRRDGAQAAAVLYVPGGSFVAERSPRITALVGRMAQETGARMVIVDYRLAPEHPCPAAIQDVRAAYDLLLGQYPPERIVVAAESAGGGILLSAMQASRDAGRPIPAGMVLLSPWVDLTLSSWSVVSKSLSAGSPFAMEVASLCAQLYLDGRIAVDAIASPLFGAMHDLPETLVHASESDLLFDDSARLATRLREAGTPVTLRVWRYEEHAFERLLGPEGERSIREIAAFMRRTLALAA